MSNPPRRCQCPFLRTAAEIQRLMTYGLVFEGGRFSTGPRDMIQPFIVASLREQYGCDGPVEHGECPWARNLYHQVDVTTDDRVPLVGRNSSKETGQYM